MTAPEARGLDDDLLEAGSWPEADGVGATTAMRAVVVYGVATVHSVL